MRRWVGTCDRCGGEGFGITPAWGQVHTDARICAEVLARRLAEAKDDAAREGSR